MCRSGILPPKQIKLNQMRKGLLFTFSMLITSCGKDGDVGPAGTDGAVGPAGADGSIIYSGEGLPGTDIGQDGDYYLDLSTGILYGPKSEGEWGNSFSLTGTNGTDGSVIHSGTILPSSETGLPEGFNEGDFFLDTDDYLLYGPLKEGNGATAWGPGLQLKGADGNANVQTFKLEVDEAKWAYFQNTTTNVYKTKTYSTTFSALTQNIVENGAVLIYRKNTLGGYQLVPYITYNPMQNIMHFTGYTKKVDDVYQITVGYILEARGDASQILTPSSSSKYKIIVIQGSAAEVIASKGFESVMSLDLLNSELGLQL